MCHIGFSYLTSEVRNCSEGLVNVSPKAFFFLTSIPFLICIYLLLKLKRVIKVIPFILQALEFMLSYGNFLAG